MSELVELACLTGSPVEVVALDGGLTNRIYRATDASGRRVVVRLSDTKSGLLAIDREAEAEHSRIAAAAGVGPQVIEFRPADGILVVEWIDARTFTDADLHDADALTRLAALARRLHAAPRFTTDFDIFAVQQRYLGIVREHGFRLPPDYLEFADDFARVHRVLRETALPTVPCHNDLLAANVLDDGTRLWLIDYEYSGNNDPCFELGNTANEVDLDADEIAHFVAAYLGRPDPRQAARAELFALAARYAWTLWAAIQDATSPVAFDFWSWGLHKFDRAVGDFRDRRHDHLIHTVRDEGVAPWPKPST